MQRAVEVLLVLCLLVLMSMLQQSTAAPSWKPQGRFGKRGDYLGQRTKHYWKPQGRLGKRTDGFGDEAESDEAGKIPSLSGEIEFPVEAMTSKGRVDSLHLVAKICTLTGVNGFSPCSWSLDKPDVY